MGVWMRHRDLKLVVLVPGKGGGWNGRGEVLLLRKVDAEDDDLLSF